MGRGVVGKDGKEGNEEYVDVVGGSGSGTLVDNCGKGWGWEEEGDGLVTSRECRRSTALGIELGFCADLVFGPPLSLRFPHSRIGTSR
jgi:hypothetical protein